MDKVRISDFSHRENTYAVEAPDGTAIATYKTTALIIAAKDLKPFDLPLQAIAIGNAPWSNSIKSFISHCRRVEQADLKYPIILDSEGYICDGWHRVAKAILAGHTSIKAVRLEIMPQPIAE